MVLAASARVGSAGRPHPIWVREAIAEASRKLCENDVDHLIYVFGPESDGLTNAEVGLCDWVVTIPSSLSYRSLNLAQACMIFAYETQLNLLKPPEEFKSVRPSERAKLISHLIVLAETVGFILPSDPYKMKPRLERILSRLPNHIDGIKTLHGFIDQVVRSVRKGSVDYKGRFLRKVETMEEHNGK